MVKVDIKGKNFYIDDYLKQNLDHLKKSVERNWDMVGVIDGREGTAKSTLAQMIGFYLSDGNLKNENIVFTAEQFSEAVDKAKPKEAIIFDEMVMAGMSSDALSGIQKTLIKKFTLIRKKQLYIILIIPYIFMLQKYFAIGRSRFLIHCYSPDGISRGSFKFYNESKKNFLYLKHLKFWNYPKDSASYNFYGKFTDYSNMFINKEEYELKKDEAIKNITDKSDIKQIVPTKKQREALLNMSLSAIYDKDSAPYKALQRYRQKLREYE